MENENCFGTEAGKKKYCGPKIPPYYRDPLGEKAKCGERARLTDPILQLKKSKKRHSAARLTAVKCGRGGLDILERVSSYWGGDDTFTVFRTFHCWSGWQKVTPRCFFKTARSLVWLWLAACLPERYACLEHENSYANMGNSWGKPFFPIHCSQSVKTFCIYHWINIVFHVLAPLRSLAASNFILDTVNIAGVWIVLWKCALIYLCINGRAVWLMTNTTHPEN